MNDDHNAARDVIRNEYARVNYGSQKRLSKLAVQNIDNMADYIIAALTAAGYEITRRDPAAGRVCVSVEDARACAFVFAVSNDRSDQHRAERILDALTEATTG